MEFLDGEKLDQQAFAEALFEKCSVRTYDTTNQYAQSPAEQEAGNFCAQTEEQE